MSLTAERPSRTEEAKWARLMSVTLSKAAIHAPKWALEVPGFQSMQNSTASRSFPAASRARILRSSRW